MSVLLLGAGKGGAGGAGGGGGGGGGFAYATGPARYWRVLISDTNGAANCSIAELQLHETMGGSNVATGGTASASSIVTIGFPASNAFDGNAGTWWISGTTQLFWLAYDLGSGNDKEITEISLKARNDGAGLTELPNTFAVQQSSDGSTWLTTWFVTGQSGWSSGETRIFTKTTPDTAAHTYWRLRAFTTQGGPNFALSELEFRATVGGADQATGGTVLKSSQFDGTTHAAINAFDNSTATVWATLVAPPGWIGYQFPSAVSVLQIAVNSRNDASFNQAPKAFAVEWSNDGSTWTPAWIAEFPAFAQNELKTSTRA